MRNVKCNTILGKHIITVKDLRYVCTTKMFCISAKLAMVIEAQLYLRWQTNLLRSSPAHTYSIIF